MSLRRMFMRSLVYDSIAYKYRYYLDKTSVINHGIYVMLDD